MNNTVKNIKNAQGMQMIDEIASRLTIENHKKFSECLLKKQMKEAVRGAVLPKKSKKSIAIIQTWRQIVVEFDDTISVKKRVKLR